MGKRQSGKREIGKAETKTAGKSEQKQTKATKEDGAFLNREIKFIS
jgi:hypothetical protein